MRILQTDRLNLRWLLETDAPFILRLLNEPGWLRFIGDRGVRDLEGARRYVLEGPARLYPRGLGLYAVELRSEGVPIGICGLIEREGLDGVDLGFAFLEEFEGQGFATEAAAATLGYAASTGRTRVLAITTEENARSAALLTKLGFAREGQVTLDAEPVELYAWST